MEETPNKIAGHEYDGIEELDNSLPRWWINLFYITIVFAGIYFVYYSLGNGPTLVREYQADKDKLDAAQQAKANQIKPASEEELRALLKDPAKKLQGKNLFQARCVSCHGSQGEGGIGPNLTDDYWIHGGKLVEITQTITQGVLDKGMPPWGPLLSQDEIHSLTVYVKSLRGTHPPNAKGPQGVLVKE